MLHKENGAECYRAGRADERAAIVAWLRGMWRSSDAPLVEFWLDAIERGEHTCQTSR
jgi:hypothetical protein